jgi:hypothetical protein
MANRYRGAVAAPWFGNGFYFRLTWSDLAEIESKHGADWWTDVVGRLEMFSPGTVMEIAAVALRGSDDRKPSGFGWPDETPVAEVAKVLLECLSLAAQGKSYDALVAEAEEKMRKAMEAAAPALARPTTGPASSSTSGAPPSGLGSVPPSSGN